MAEKNVEAQLPKDKITNLEFAVMLFLAGVKDVLDLALLAAAGTGLVLNRITNIFVVSLLWLWIFYRLHRFPTKRFVAGAVAEFIPLIGELPVWSAFVIILWAQTKTPLGKLSLKKSVRKLSKERGEQISRRLSSRRRKGETSQRPPVQKTSKRPGQNPAFRDRSPQPKLYSPATIRSSQPIKERTSGTERRII